VFQPHFVRGVIDLYEAVRDHDAAKARHAYQTWGFADISAEQVAEHLQAVSTTLPTA